MVTFRGEPLATISQELRSIVDADGAVILDIKHDSLSTLNSTGAYVWNRLLQGRSTSEIVRELADETLTDLAIVERDVQGFLDQLKSRRLTV
jgi:hypothetical protein